MRICGLSWVTQFMNYNRCFCTSCGGSRTSPKQSYTNAQHDQVLLGSHFLGYSTWTGNIKHN